MPEYFPDYGIWKTLCNPTSKDKVFFLSIFALAAIFTLYFGLNHSHWFRMESQHGFDLCFTINKDVEHFFRCFSGFEIPKLRILFSSRGHFFVRVFVFLESSFLNSLYILNISPRSDVGLVKIFSPLLGCHFVLLTVSFALQSLFSFRKSIC